MTGNCNLISRHNWIYVTYSGRVGHTARSSIKIVKVFRLEQLLTGNSDQISLHICLYVTYSGRGDQSAHSNC